MGGLIMLDRIEKWAPPVMAVCLLILLIGYIIDGSVVWSLIAAAALIYFTREAWKAMRN
jgi:hypothetical protein